MANEQVKVIQLSYSTRFQFSVDFLVIISYL